MRQKSLHLGCTHIFWVALVVKKNEALDPIGVRFFSANAVVPRAQMFTQTGEQLGGWRGVHPPIFRPL
jgi:hypothetical protein